jgi:hypothetical protein
VTTVSVSTEVDAPPERTWAVVTDWARQGEWMPLTRVAAADGAARGVGDRLAARTGLGPVGFTDRMVVDVWDPPYRCEVVHRGRVVTGRGVFLVEPLPGGRSRFTWQEVSTAGLVSRLANALTAPATRVLLGYAVRRLARLVEATSIETPTGEAPAGEAPS